MVGLPAWGRAKMPKCVSFRRILGPSFILLGLGLGSGELILWPYLVANYGLGIIWGALVGITLQFFINMEIERYALVTGESVFVGMARRYSRWIGLWFVFSTFLPWMWPGIVAASARVIVEMIGWGQAKWVGVGLLLLIGLILSLGRVIYKTQERWQKWLILLGVPLVLVLALVLAGRTEWEDLGAGLLGRGEGYWFLPAGLPIFVFLGALAYSGAGGNLNLAQSYYVKEKGYGMGKYSGRITSLLRGKIEKVSLTGKTFKLDRQGMGRFRAWWKLINLEHGLVFWLTGLVTMLMLALLAYSTVYGKGGLGGINFLLAEAEVIGQRVWAGAGTAFLLVAGMMLFSTQLSVLDATSRIMSENLVILGQGRFKVGKMPSFFYLFLWLQILAGGVILLLGFEEPFTLVVIGAVLNAFSMFVYSGLVLGLNLSILSKELRPAWWRVGVLGLIVVFLGVFSVVTISQYLRGFLGV